MKKLITLTLASSMMLVSSLSYSQAPDNSGSDRTPIQDQVSRAKANAKGKLSAAKANAKASAQDKLSAAKEKAEAAALEKINENAPKRPVRPFPPLIPAAKK